MSMLWPRSGVPGGRSAHPSACRRRTSSSGRPADLPYRRAETASSWTSSSWTSYDRVPCRFPSTSGLWKSPLVVDPVYWSHSKKEANVTWHPTEEIEHPGAEPDLFGLPSGDRFPLVRRAISSASGARLRRPRDRRHRIAGSEKRSSMNSFLPRCVASRAWCIRPRQVSSDM
jgi:hypothetical protein